MDTSGKRRRSWTVEVKRRIAEESFEGNASVAQLSQKYAVNANQIFQWRKKYREGRLENSTSINLLPVTVSKEVAVESRKALAAGLVRRRPGLCRSNFPKELCGLRAA